MFGFGKKKSAFSASVQQESTPAQRLPLATIQEKPTLPPGISLIHALRGHTSYVGRIAWSPDGRVIASASDDSTVRIWSAETGACSTTLKGHQKTVHCVAFHPNGQLVASTGEDKTVRLWEHQSGRLIRTVESPQTVYGVTFEPAGRFLVTAGEGTIHFRDATSGRLLETTRGPRGSAFMGSWVAFHPKGQMLACGASTLKLFELPSGRLLRELDEHDGSPINSVAFSPDGEIVVTTSSDRTLRLCDSNTGQPIRTLEGHTGESYCADFSGDGRIIASRGGDSVRIWNYQIGTCVTVPTTNFGSWLPGLTFHPTRPLLATAISDPGVPKRDPRADSVIYILNCDVSALLGL